LTYLLEHSRVAMESFCLDFLDTVQAACCGLTAARELGGRASGLTEPRHGAPQRSFLHAKIAKAFHCLIYRSRNLARVGINNTTYAPIPRPLRRLIFSLSLRLPAPAAARAARTCADAPAQLAVRAGGLACSILSALLLTLQLLLVGMLLPPAP
jgi:hypothetical protein